MSVNTVNIATLVEWLGRDGAIAGLKESRLTVPDLCGIAERSGVTVEKRTPRTEIIVDLVNRDATRIDKTVDELMAMKYDDLKTYFVEKKVSMTELRKLLAEFGIPARRIRARELVDFAAREISGIGMYGRIAQGPKHA